MPVAFILDFPGAPPMDDDAAPGRLCHGAGMMKNGLRVLEVWESDAQFEASMAGKATPDITRMEVAHTRLPDRPIAPATFAQVVRLDGVDAAGFAVLDAQAGPASLAPNGCVYHVNGPVDGGWMVIDFWVSHAIRDRFMSEEVAPALRAAGFLMLPVEALYLDNAIIPTLASA